MFRLIFFIFLSTVFVFSCTLDRVTYEFVRGPRIPPRREKYNLTDVEEHLVSDELRDFRKNTKTTFSCIDGRNDEKSMTAPGGDFGEFLIGLQTYLYHVDSLKPSKEFLHAIFERYLKEVATPDRPFYFHTSKHRLDHMFEHLDIEPKPVILPESEPPKADLWYEAFRKSQFQGCGLIRYMISNYTEFRISDENLVPNMLEVFLKYWWTADPQKKSLIKFDILQGDPDPQAIVTIDNAGPGCSDYSPIARPNIYGSSIYLYHPSAVLDFRHQVLYPFFRRYDPTVEYYRFIKDLDTFAVLQLEMVTQLLEPANEIDTFSVKVYTSGDPDVSVQFISVSTVITVVAIILSIGGVISIIISITSFILGRRYQRKLDNQDLSFLDSNSIPIPMKPKKSKPVMQEMAERQENVEDHIQLNFSLNYF